MGTESVEETRREALTARRDARVQSLHQLLATTLPPGPFILEIGCGHGHFLTSFVQHHPHILCVGIDVSKDRIVRAQRKARRLNNKWLHFLLADAVEFIASLPTEPILQAIFVLFPDPWPKRRHHKNRVMQPEFLQKLAHRASAGARLYFRTDYEPYFQATSKMIADSPDWQLSPEPWPFEAETVFQARATSFHSLVATRR